MSILETRRLNLNILIQEYGSQKNLAWATKHDVGYIENLLNVKNGISEECARSLEVVTGKPSRWLDTVDTRKLNHIDSVLLPVLIELEKLNLTSSVKLILEKLLESTKEKQSNLFY